MRATSAGPLPRPPDTRPERHWPHRLTLAGVLLGALALRLWGVAQGLPFAFNADENSHFVPRAIGMFGHTLNPGYFSNPPGLTYVLHLVFAVWFGGRVGVSRSLALHPTDVFVAARVSVAVLSALAVWMLYLTGRRLFDRWEGLLGAALLAVAFLPVYYSHLALNDAPTLAPLTLSLLGSAGILRYGRPLDYAVAGLGVGLGCAFKYTAGIVVVPLMAGAALHFLSPAGERRAVIGLGVAAVVALVCFLIANPYSVLDFSAFRDGLVHQSSVSAEAGGKLGAPRGGALAYYLWTFTWGLGWVPALAALGGAVLLWWDERPLLLVLVLPILLFLAFMSLQGRYFGRWLIPILPLVCLLSAHLTLRAVRWAARRRARLRPLAAALATLALLAQGLVYSIHSAVVLARADTRNLTRSWMVAHVPVGAHLVVEPVVPDTWVQDPGHPTPQTYNGNRWIKYPALRSVIAPDGSVHPDQSSVVGLEDYERTLSPQLISYYESQGACWVVSGATQSGRVLADPRQVPLAVAYYRALARQAQVVYQVSPYRAHQAPVAFNFDWTFDAYNLAYARPGPAMTVYRLTGGACAARRRR